MFFRFAVAILVILSSVGGIPYPRDEYIGKFIKNIKIFDQDGNEFFIMDLIENKPAIISPIYTKCPSFCSMITAKLAQMLEGDLGRKLGDDFKIITFSFDHKDTKDDLKGFQLRWNIDGKSWVVVGSNSRDDIALFLNSLDYRIEEDPETGEIYHPNVVVVVDGYGKIVRFLHIFRISEKDLALALASAEGLSPKLLIYRYNNSYGRYEINLHLVIGGIIFLFFTLITLGILLLSGHLFRKVR